MVILWFLIMFNLFRNLMTKVKEKIQKVYPDAFETLTYQNYKAKFHTLLFMEEIEVSFIFTYLLL